MSAMKMPTSCINASLPQSTLQKLYSKTYILHKPIPYPDHIIVDSTYDFYEIVITQ